MIHAIAGAHQVAKLQGAPIGLDIAPGTDDEGFPLREGQLTARIIDGDEVLVIDLPITAGLDGAGDPLELYTAAFTAPATLPVAIEWWQQFTVLPAPAERVLYELVTGDPAPPGDGVLCTLADVRGRRQTRGEDVAQDAEVLRVIAGVSAAITTELEREFTPTDDATRVFELRAGEDRIVLTPYEIRTVTQIRINPDADDPKILAASDYKLSPDPAEHGTYHRIRLRTAVTPEAGWRHVDLEVTGDWGMETIPADVREAAIIAVVHNMRTTVGQYSIADGAGGETRYERTEIPQAARDLLKPFRRQARYV
ncbi:MAG: hypothetical protein Q8O56_13900 [Solirubrobacteraceae bacterium]|nr:hypothetical protein [Solirubrobacteraceae bacterium]